jgi:phage/plasmid-like protein (TIGR03299 family)
MPDALTLRLFGRDEIRPYLCFVDGKAGNSSLRMFPTTVRVVCQNTLRLAIGEHGSDGFTIRHTGSIHTRRESAIRAMKNFGQAIKTHHEAMSFLASKTLTSERIIALVADEILAPESGKEQSHQAKRKVETIIDLVEGGIGTDIPGVRGTAYGVFQAVTEFASHYAPARGTLTEQAESRLERVLGGDKLSQRALEVMLAA